MAVRSTKTPSTQHGARQVQQRAAPTSYTIKSGDTLGAIAQRFNLSVDELMAANADKIKDPNKIFAGHTIRLPKGGEQASPVQTRAAAEKPDGDSLTRKPPAEQAKVSSRDVAPAADARLGATESFGMTGLLAHNRTEQKPATPLEPAASQPLTLSEKRAHMAALFNEGGSRRLTDGGVVTEKWGLFKKGDIECESIELKHRESDQRRRFLHLELKNFKDKLTNHDELKETERFIQMMDGEVSEKQVKNENPSWWNRHINPATHGKTKVNADVYLSTEAMQAVAGASREEALQAYGRAVQKLEGMDHIPAWASPDPDLRDRAREMLDDYEQGGGDNNNTSNADYWFLTDRNAWADKPHWEKAKTFAKFVQREAGQGEQAFMEGFAKLAKRGDFYGAVGAMNELSTDEPVLLSKLALTGKEAQIKSDGPAGRIAPSETLAIDKIFKMRSSEVEEKHLVNTHPFTTDNKVELLVDGTQAFPAIFDAVEKAEKSINVSFYIFNDDELGNRFADTLIAKARDGVEVNLMVDGVGSVQLPGLKRREIIDRMEAGGVKVIRNHVFNPTNKAEVLNHPDHRKLVIVDGETAFTGGMNIGDHYISEYHDIMIKVEGSAAQQMQAEWLTSWMHLGGSIDRTKQTPAEIRDHFLPEQEKPAGGMKARVIQSIPGEHREIFDNYLKLIGEAERTIRIENPYCTNPEIQDALIAAARRGVDVKVILPGESDHGFSHLAAKSRYPAMLDAGVKIYEYPGFNHGKIMVVDEEKVTVGSSNLDDVALRHIYELNIVAEDEAFAAKVKQEIFDVDLAKSRLMQQSDITEMDVLSGSFFNMFHDII